MRNKQAEVSSAIVYEIKSLVRDKSGKISSSRIEALNDIFESLFGCKKIASILLGDKSNKRKRLLEDIDVESLVSILIDADAFKVLKGIIHLKSNNSKFTKNEQKKIKKKIKATLKRMRKDFDIQAVVSSDEDAFDIVSEYAKEKEYDDGDYFDDDDEDEDDEDYGKKRKIRRSKLASLVGNTRHQRKAKKHYDDDDEDDCDDDEEDDEAYYDENGRVIINDKNRIDRIIEAITILGRGNSQNEENIKRLNNKIDRLIDSISQGNVIQTRSTEDRIDDFEAVTKKVKQEKKSDESVVTNDKIDHLEKTMTKILNHHNKLLTALSEQFLTLRDDHDELVEFLGIESEDEEESNGLDDDDFYDDEDDEEDDDDGNREIIMKTPETQKSKNSNKSNSRAVDDTRKKTRFNLAKDYDDGYIVNDAVNEMFQAAITNGFIPDASLSVQENLANARKSVDT